MKVSMKIETYQMETRKGWFSSDYETCWSLKVTIALEPDEYDAFAQIADVAFFKTSQPPPEFLLSARNSSDPHPMLFEPLDVTVHQILRGSFELTYSTQANAINDERKLREALKKIKAEAFAERDKDTEFEI